METLNSMTPLFFKDAFWGSEFTSRAGYDALTQRLQDGRNMCKDVEELIKMRALAEERYGKELLTIAHKAKGHTEISTLRASFDQLKAQIKNIGDFHIQLSAVLREEVKKIELFQERQKEQSKKFKTIMEKVMKITSACYKKTMESKNIYKQKCWETYEAEHMADNIYDLQSTTTSSSTPKILEKAHQKVKRCRWAAKEAEKLYLGNIERLERLRQDWVETHKSTCEVFQQLEADRISYLRCIIWDHCNHFSMQCVRDDELYEEVRGTLEKCDITTENNCFIQMKKTGSNPPDPIVFENYSVLKERSEVNDSTVSVAERFSIIQGNSLDSNILITDSNSESTTSSGHSLDIINASVSGFQPATSYATGDYDSYMVVYEYTAQIPDELSVLRGEVIQVIEQGDDGWSTVSRNGETGLVPGNYLTKI